MTATAGYAYVGGDTWVPPEPTPCADDPESWFDPTIINRIGAGDQRRARALCRGCPQRLPCTDAALLHEAGKPTGERFGVWGGLLPVERAELDQGDAA